MTTAPDDLTPELACSVGIEGLKKAAAQLRDVMAVFHRAVGPGPLQDAALEGREIAGELARQVDAFAAKLHERMREALKPQKVVHRAYVPMTGGPRPRCGVEGVSTLDWSRVTCAACRSDVPRLAQRFPLRLVRDE